MSLANLRFPCSSWTDIFALLRNEIWKRLFNFCCFLLGVSFNNNQLLPVVIYRFGASIQLELYSTDGYMPFANPPFYTICLGSILLRAGSWQMLLDVVGWFCACAAKSFPRCLQWEEFVTGFQPVTRSRSSSTSTQERPRDDDDVYNRPILFSTS